MSTYPNSWALRFEPLLNRVALQKAVESYPQPLTDLGKFSGVEAEERLKIALKEIFYPSEQCLDILQEWIGEAYAYASLTYSDPQEFCASIQSGIPPLPEWSDISILTGLAGVGKTSVVEALQRALKMSASLRTPDGTEWPLQSSWHVTFRDIKTENGFWQRIGSPYSATHDNVTYSRRLAYRLGVSRLNLDELQYFTLSSDANTAITRLLMAASNLGLPTNATGNYSLVRRLMKREAPDRQRLLSKITVMMPDDPEGADWMKFLMAQKAALPEVLEIDPKNDGARINILSGGQKRAEVRLLAITYRRMRVAGNKDVRITLGEIENTFKSKEFQFHREEIEEISRRAVTNVTKDDDMSCPIELPETLLLQFKRRAEQERNARLAIRELEDSLSSKDKQALKGLNKSTQKVRPSGEVLSIKPKRRPKQPLADLAKNSANFSENL